MPKTSKIIKRPYYRKKRSTIKKYSTRRYRKNKRSNALAKGTTLTKGTTLAKGPTSDNVNCCICDKEISREDSLVPAVCLSKNGDIRGHRICKECWFNGFAKEGVNHECPGCVKNLPLNGQPIDKTVVIDLTED